MLTVPSSKPAKEVNLMLPNVRNDKHMLTVPKADGTFIQADMVKNWDEENGCRNSNIFPKLKCTTWYLLPQKNSAEVS